MLWAVFVISLVSAAAVIPPPTEVWYTQTLDHFNAETQPQTFQARYLMNDDFWTHKFEKGAGGDANVGPIFFYCGNEGPIEMFRSNTGFVFDIAPQFNALIIFAEHRFYGKSLPFGSDSFDRSHVGLLSVEQALADYAQLIQQLKQQLGAQAAPVAVFGGSYGGMLAAWFRLRYPHIVDAALAASAPVFMSGPTVDYSFFQAVTNDFAGADARCPNLVRTAFQQLLSLAAQGPSGYNALTQQFSLCNPVRSAADANHLLLWVVNAFTSIAMCDYPYPTGFLAPLPAWPVNVACKIMTSGSGPSLLPQLAQAAGLFYNGTSGTLPCFNTTDEFIECEDQTGCGTGFDGFAWDYQACSEMTFLASTNNVTDMFPPRVWDLNAANGYCTQRWGIATRPDWLGTQYGSTPDDFRSASNIIFSNGLLDPWHPGGVLQSLSDSLVAVIIKDGAHHLDLRGSNKDDPQSVIVARQQEVALLQKWLTAARKH